MNKARNLGVMIFITLIVFYLFCVHFTDQYHVAITRNLKTGEVRCDVKGGFHITMPWVQAARIDVRPVRVCITSTARTFNCKLVEFEPAAYAKFVKTQGFRYYWWANRISFNFGYSEEYRGMKDVLRGYAFGMTQYSFIRVLRDYPGP